MFRRHGAAILLGALAAGCAGSSSAPPPARTPPDLASFLRLPVATPTACPRNVNGTTAGRRSPWVGHVDVSVFIATSATPATVRSLGDTLRGTPHVRTVYFESRRQAYAEFQRLYTCSARVSPRDVPASYRLVLDEVSHQDRDDLVRSVLRLPGVKSVSCDPSDPCVNVAARGG